MIVRVVAEVKRMTSLFSANSTSVLPHQPSPTMPALITGNSRERFRLSFERPNRYFGHVNIASTTQASIQNTQYSMPPITQIHFLVTL